VKRLIPLGVLVLVAGVMAVVVKLVPPKSPDVPPARSQAVPVEVITIRPVAQLADVFTLPATVEANRVVEVSAEVAGRVERIAIQQGRPVRQGQAIVYLNTDLLKAEFDRARAQAEYDRREYERIEELRERGVATASELDQSRTAAATSQAALDAAKANLQRATIVAPITGVLDNVPVEIGEYVKSGDLVAKIVDIDTVKIVADVPERDVHYLKRGGEAKIVAAGADALTVTGRITYISEQADMQTRTSRVEITVDNRKRQLRCGRILRASLTRRMLPDAIIIPLAAVIPLESGKAVYVVVDGKAKRRKVTLELMTDWKVRVLEGLKGGDMLIVKGHRYVSPDEPVTIEKDK